MQIILYIIHHYIKALLYKYSTFIKVYRDVADSAINQLEQFNDY